MTFPHTPKLLTLRSDELLSGCTVKAYRNNGDERKQREKTASIKGGEERCGNYVCP